jgi:hypothetical protein
MVTQNAQDGDADAVAQVSYQELGFLGKTIVCEVSTEQEDVGFRGGLAEGVAELSAGVTTVVHVGHRGDTERL